MVSQEELEALTKEIIQIVSTEKILLFGSYATGNPDQESDVDLCVITNEEQRKLDIMRKIRRNLSIDYPLDLIVYNKDEFYQKADVETSFEHQLLEEGANLYG